MRDVERWFMSEYEELMENIRQRERSLETTVYYGLVALSAVSAYLLVGADSWRLQMALFLSFVFLVFFLHIIRLELEIMWFATCIECKIQPKITPFYAGERVLEWEAFRSRKRLDVLDKKSLLKSLPMLIIEAKPISGIPVLVYFTLLSYGIFTWVTSGVTTSQLALTVSLILLHVVGLVVTFLAAKELVKASKRTTASNAKDREEISPKTNRDMELRGRIP